MFSNQSNTYSFLCRLLLRKQVLHRRYNVKIMNVFFSFPICLHRSRAHIKILLVSACNYMIHMCIDSLKENGEENEKSSGENQTQIHILWWINIKR
jgi:hypothetical protein